MPFVRRPEQLRSVFTLTLTSFSLGTYKRPTASALWVCPSFFARQVEWSQQSSHWAVIFPSSVAGCWGYKDEEGIIPNLWEHWWCGADRHINKWQHLEKRAPQRETWVSQIHPACLEGHFIRVGGESENPPSADDARPSPWGYNTSYSFWALTLYLQVLLHLSPEHLH